MRGVVLTLARLGFATAAVVAITYQFASLRHGVPTFSAANFFSFFTIQTNLLAVAMLVLVVIVRPLERTILFDTVRGAVTLYIAITGIVFALLLAGLQESLDTHIAWVDFTVHKLIPIVLVADWLLDPPRHRLSPRISASWLLYPLAYLVYTLIRGEDVDWYPYPYLDVSRHGYGRVLLNCAAMLIGIVGAVAAFVLVGNRRSRGVRRSVSA
jgi:hypothetical protein